MEKSSQYIFMLALLVASVQVSLAQVCGCTDSLALNYNAYATLNDGSCVYDVTQISTDGVGMLDPQLGSTSSIFFWDNGYWTNNDHNDSCLYKLDSANAQTLETRCFDAVWGYDMEEISQDSLYLYLGDIGNNNGSRHDLHFLRIQKESILNQAIEIDTIGFSYEDQTDFTFSPQGTDFDCEAFVVTHDSIYLFTKQWVSTQTTIYSIPKTPGHHMAQRRATYNVNGLITGATYLPEYQLIALCGYDYDPENLAASLHPFIILLYDFQGDDFFSGNKRRLDFNFSARAQIEAIATHNALDFYITNEHTTIPLLDSDIDIPAALQRLDLRDFLLPYLSRFGVTDQPNLVPDLDVHEADIRIYPNPASDVIHIDCPPNFLGAEYQIINANGQTMFANILNSRSISLNNISLPIGTYFLVLQKNGKIKTFHFLKNE